MLSCCPRHQCPGNRPRVSSITQQFSVIGSQFLTETLPQRPYSPVHKDSLARSADCRHNWINMKIQVSELRNGGDARGSSITTPSEALEFVERFADMHLASTAPGAMRGNHYHSRRREAIILLPG